MASAILDVFFRISEPAQLSRQRLTPGLSQAPVAEGGPDENFEKQYGHEKILAPPKPIARLKLVLNSEF
jgi:hypothetical protein